MQTETIKHKLTFIFSMELNRSTVYLTTTLYRSPLYALIMPEQCVHCVNFLTVLWTQKRWRATCQVQDWFNNCQVQRLPSCNWTTSSVSCFSWLKWNKRLHVRKNIAFHNITISVIIHTSTAYRHKKYPKKYESSTLSKNINYSETIYLFIITYLAYLYLARYSHTYSLYH